MTIKNDDLYSRFPHLGKLTLAIIENIVSPILGEAGIEIVKEPAANHQLRDDLCGILVETEKRFIQKCTEEKIADGGIVQLKLADLPSIRRVFWAFVKDKDLSVSDFAEAIDSQLRSEYPNGDDKTRTRVVTLYMQILRDRMIGINSVAREKLGVFAQHRIEDGVEKIATNTAEMKNIMAEMSDKLGKLVTPSIIAQPKATTQTAIITKYEEAILVSYAWGGESERTLDKLERAFTERGIRIVRDKKDLKYKGSIEEFEQRIGRGECIILVISDEYLRSEHCMYELVEIRENQEFRKRIFPIVLGDAQIYKAIDRLAYIKYWGEKITELDQAIKQITPMTNLAGVNADLDKYARIRAEFDHLTDLLSDMNALTPEIHATSGFSTLIGAIESALHGRLPEHEPHNHIAQATSDLPDNKPEQLPKNEISDPATLLPKGYRLPFLHNHAFTDRSDEMNALENSLLTNKKVAVITGIGGVGKTQLAVEFCYRFGSEFDGVHWVDARQSKSIDAEIAACGRAMRLPGFPSTTEEQVEETLMEWQKEPHRLVVLDNVYDPWLLRKLLTRLNGLRILVTSRSSKKWNTSLGFDVCPLNSLPRNESLALLRKLAPDLDAPDNELTKVADRLGDLPLALDLAGRYFNAKFKVGGSLTPSEYLVRLGNALKHTSMCEDWEGDGNSTDHTSNLFATFFVSWEQLDKDKDALTIIFFGTAGYLTPNVPIPHEFFAKIANENDDEADNTDIAIGQLQGLGLLSDKLSLHPLLAEFARLIAGSNDVLIVALDKMIELLNSKPEENLLQLIAPLRRHIESLVSNAAKEKLSIVSVTILLRRLGEYYQLVEEDPAVDAYKRAIEIEKEKGNANSLNIASIYNQLGDVYRKLGDSKGAISQYRHALEIYKKENLQHHPVVSIIRKSLDEVEGELGNIEST